MKKLLSTLAFLAVLGVAMSFTNPKADAHKQAIIEKISQPKDNSLLGKAGSILAGQLGNYALDECLTVDNYLVCSVGKISLLGKQETVSFGIFGNVFTFNLDNK